MGDSLWKYLKFSSLDSHFYLKKTKIDKFSTGFVYLILLIVDPYKIGNH